MLSQPKSEFRQNWHSQGFRISETLYCRIQVSSAFLSALKVEREGGTIYNNNNNNNKNNNNAFIGYKRALHNTIFINIFGLNSCWVHVHISCPHSRAKASPVLSLAFQFCAVLPHKMPNLFSISCLHLGVALRIYRFSKCLRHNTP